MYYKKKKKKIAQLCIVIEYVILVSQRQKNNCGELYSNTT